MWKKFLIKTYLRNQHEHHKSYLICIFWLSPLDKCWDYWESEMHVDSGWLTHVRTRVAFCPWFCIQLKPNWDLTNVDLLIGLVIQLKPTNFIQFWSKANWDQSLKRIRCICGLYKLSLGYFFIIIASREEGLAHWCPLHCIHFLKLKNSNLNGKKSWHLR